MIPDYEFSWWYIKLKDWENRILWRICEWIIKRRDVAFIYWVNPPEWEAFFKESMGDKYEAPQEW